MPAEEGADLFKVMAIPGFTGSFRIRCRRFIRGKLDALREVKLSAVGRDAEQMIEISEHQGFSKRIWI